MKQVYVLRRKGRTLRQKLGENYPSWYFDKADSIEVQEMKQAVDDGVADEQRQGEEECQRERELDEDVPIITLKTTGKIKCIDPDCAYRFDTRDQMHRHFYDCFSKAVDAEPTDWEDVRRLEREYEHDDLYGVTPVSYYYWYEEDEKAGRWDKYAAKNADGGMMFNPWAEEDAVSMVGTKVQHEQ